jgi:hypothetical protein
MIVQRLADHPVAWFGVESAQKVPSRCEWLKIVTSWPCMLDKEYRPAGAADPYSQTVDPLDDGDEVVLCCTSQKARLHVNDQEHVHLSPPRHSGAQRKGVGVLGTGPSQRFAAVHVEVQVLGILIPAKVRQDPARAVLASDLGGRGPLSASSQ